MTAHRNSNRRALLTALHHRCGCIPSIAEWTGKQSVYQTLSSRFRKFCRQREGNALVEFAFVAPMLLCLLVGLVFIGVAVNNYITLTDAISQGARAFAESTGITASPVNGDPCAYAVSVMNSDAKSLATANITYTITYTPASTGTTSGNLGSTCKGTFSGMTEGDAVSISATYPTFMVSTTYQQGGGVLILPKITSSWIVGAHTTQIVQ